MYTGENTGPTTTIEAKAATKLAKPATVPAVATAGRGPIEYKILLAYGFDAVGRMGALGNFICDRGGNVLDFRFMTMGKFYSASLHIGAYARDMARIAQDAETSMLFRPTVRPPVQQKPQVRRGLRDTRHAIQVTAMDHAGMIQEVGSTIATFGINIAFAEGLTYPEPLDERPYFTMRMLVDVPHEQGGRLDELRTALERTESNYGYKVYGPSPEIELAYFTPINWTENRLDVYELN